MLRLVLIASAATLQLSACGTTPPPPEPVAMGAVPEPAPKPRPTSTVPAPPAAPSEPTLLLLDSTDPTHCRLAEELRACSSIPLQLLQLDKEPNAALQKRLTQSRGPIVALGLEAAQRVAGLAKNRTVLFSLVFNHGDYRLLDQGMIGISMLPPPGQVVALLHKLAPDVKRLAVPSGPGLRAYLEQVRKAATINGLKLVTTEIGSNKELLLFAGKLDPTVGAFWLLPDNRILSRETIRQLLGNNLKAGRRTLVFTPELFPFGGLVSARFDNRAVAVLLTEQLKKSPQEQARLKGKLLQPANGRFDINAELAGTLGMKIPPDFASLLRRGEP